MLEAVFLFAVYALAAALALAVYARAGVRVARGGGRVVVAGFGAEDLLVAGCFGGWLGSMAVRSMGAPRRALEMGDLVGGAVLMLILTAGVLLFFGLRGRSLAGHFGLRGVRAGEVARQAMLFGVAALPPVLVAGVLTRMVMGEGAERQEVVDYFFGAAGAGDGAGVLAVWLLGGVVAPVTEEILFRGYFYGAFKRFGGKCGAMVLSAAVFALIHGNAAAIPSLVVLALCLSVAYEASGTLWVPVLMHAGFNLSMLAAMAALGPEIGG